MCSMLPAPSAKLLIIELPLNQFLVLAHIIITPLANDAAEREKVVCMFRFSHDCEYI